MKYNKISTNDRMRIIEAFNNEEDWTKIAKTLGVNSKTAYNWITNRQDLSKKNGGNKNKKSPEMLKH